MDSNNSYMSEEMKLTDTDIGEEIISLDDANGSKKRASKVDRSGNTYSEEKFRVLPREEQLRLANKHWMDSKGYDASGIFQFSYTHFSNICKELGFVKGVIDTRKDASDTKEYASDSKKVEPCSILYIDHGKREETEVKKLTFAKDTIDKIDQLLGDKLSNVEKSKVIDVILSEALDNKLAAKRVGQLVVAYRPVYEVRLI